MYRCYLVCAFILTGLQVPAQPTPRASAQLIYMPGIQSVLLVDGYENGTYPVSGKSETWAWKNNQWTKLIDTDHPFRSLSSAVYDSHQGSIFLFGGIGNKGYDDSLKQAFSFDGSTWHTLPGNNPGTRDHHEMVYDEQDRCVLLYGGQTGNRSFDTATWLYKNSEWSGLNIPGPGGRVHHAMAYDPVRKKTVLFGGSNGNGTFDETWEFDGMRWHKIAAGINPGHRTHHSMVYDPSRKKIVLYGGVLGMDIQKDIWAWDGKGWEKLSDNGPARLLAGMTFHSGNNKLYVYGGNGGEQMLYLFADLWEWDGNWKQVWNGKIYKFDMGQSKFTELK